MNPNVVRTIKTDNVSMASRIVGPILDDASLYNTSLYDKSVAQRNTHSIVFSAEVSHRYSTLDGWLLACNVSLST